VRKFIALVVKDFKIQYNSPLMLVFSLGFPLLYLFLFGFMEKSSQNNLQLWVDEELSYEFEDKTQTNLQYLDATIPINIEYAKREKLLADFDKGKLPVIYYLADGEKTLFLNMNKNKSTLVYNMLRNKFYPVETKHFNLKTKFSMNYALLSMVFNFLLLFSSLSFGSALMSLEIKKHNILILLKAGISKGELIVSKLLGVFVMQVLTFIVFYTVAILTKQLSFNLAMIWYIPFIIIPTGMLGIFFSSVTANESVKALLPMFFWFPSIFFGIIKESISPLTATILKINPLILISELIEQIIRNDVSYQLLLIISGTTVVLFFISIFFMKRTIIKSM